MTWAVWITGPPAAGKTTLARAFRERAERENIRFLTLESDALRQILTPKPTYALEERDRFYRELADLGAHLVGQGFAVVFDATAPRREHRRRARRQIPSFLEVFVSLPLAAREGRDPKGLYRLARAGGAPHLPGLGESYEEPEAPDLTIPGDAPPEQGAESLFSLLRERRFVSASSSSAQRPS
jgi:adenylylsulfate kinase